MGLYEMAAQLWAGGLDGCAEAVLCRWDLLVCLYFIFLYKVCFQTSTAMGCSHLHFVNKHVFFG